MTAAESPATDGAALRVDGTCRMAIDGRRAGRTIAAWAKSFDLTEPELQLLWCLRQEPGDGVDQTTISARLVFSPAQISVIVERLRAQGLIIQRLTVGDRRRRAWRLSGDGQAVVEQLLAHVEGAGAKPQAVGVTGRVAAAVWFIRSRWRELRAPDSPAD